MTQTRSQTKRQRVESTDHISTNDLTEYKQKFNKNISNKLIQNSLCTNYLHKVSEVRDYMQSRDIEFSNTLDPELEVSNQGLSGRCWMFAVLNVMRHELIRKYQLPRAFELSEGYLCFYEKLEKCNYVLAEFLNADHIDTNDSHVRRLLYNGCDDGGLWVTCANLIKKYSIIPKTCYRESINSFSTDTMNNTVNYKLREFVSLLVNEPDKTKRLEMKNTMINQLYEMLCKMLGTPPNPNEKFKWSFVTHLDLTDRLEREKKRKDQNQYENLEIKNTFELTPLEFYHNFIVNQLDDYVMIGNDPRNEYNKYYQSYDRDVVVDGERNGFFNLSIDDIADICTRSIVDNTPVEFDCDVSKYLNPDEELLDTNCYNYDIVFGDKFETMTKQQAMECYESHANHAMVLVGVDIDQNENIIKWKVENSWGRDSETTGYYTMSHDWFKKYVFGVVVQRKYLTPYLLKLYDLEFNRPVTLKRFDIMA